MKKPKKFTGELSPTRRVYNQAIADYEAYLPDMATIGDLITTLHLGLTMEQKFKIAKALAEYIESKGYFYYIQDAELVELLPEKKYQHREYFTAVAEAFDDGFNEAITLCIKALRGKAKRGLSADEINKIRNDLMYDFPQRSYNNGMIRAYQNGIDKFIKAFYKAQCQENKVNQGLLKALRTIKNAYWTDGESSEDKLADVKEIAEQAIKEAENE